MRPRRQPRPRAAYDGDTSYPSVMEHDVSRRDFLRGAAGGAVAAGLLIAAPPLAGARRRKPASITLRFRRRYTFRYGNYQVERITVQTHDPKLAAFLRDPKRAASLEAALRPVLDKHSCVDLLEGKRLARLQGRIGKSLAKQYRTQTRSRIPAPTVVLFVGQPSDRCKGDCAAPVPICRPPRP